MPDNMGSLLRGLRIGQDIGGTIVARRNERDDRKRRRELEEELRGYTREDRATSAEDRTRRQELEDELRGYRREDRGFRIEDRGTAAADRTRRQELEDELRGFTREDRGTAAADRTRRQELEDELRGFTREDRGRAAATAGAQEYAGPAEIEAELKRMAGIADADKTPEAGDREGALRRQLAAMLEQRRQEQQRITLAQQRSTGPRETLDLDPDTGEVMTRRVVQPYTPGSQAAGGVLRDPAAAADAGGATINGPVQIRNAEDYAALPSGTDYIDPNGVRRRKP